ncbi:hypothetical protein ACFL2A_04005, partial [Thermodesulfobacteriota bacterium]
VAAILIVILTSSICFAGLKDLETTDIADREELKRITKEIGHAISIPTMSSADPYGLTGFSIGVEASTYKLEEAKDVLDDTSMVMTRAHVIKGLPFDIDVGLEYSKAYSSNIRAFGGELRWAPLTDGVATPAIGLRVTHSKLGGVDNFNLQTTTFGAEVSKSIVGVVTPFAGAQYLSSKGEVTNSTWGSVTENDTALFVGFNVSLLIIDITLQADYAENTMYTAQFGVGF